MRDQYKHIRILLQDWGSWKRKPIPEIGYPTQVAIYSDKNIDKMPSEPSWSVGHKRGALERLAARVLRYYHIRRSSTKPAYRASIPRYNGNKGMSRLDKHIQEMPEDMRILLNWVYVDEVKPVELAIIRGVGKDKIYKELGKAYDILISSNEA